MKSCVHIHIPKCAGMALRSVLERVYGDALIGLPICEEASDAAYALSLSDTFVVRESRGEPYAISGHAPFGFALPSVPHVALLRDPVSRLVSWHRMGRHEAFETILERGTYENRTLDNLQVRYLAGLRLDAGAPPVESEHVKWAVESAQQMIVGGVRELGHVVQRLALACQWERAVTIPTVNLGRDTSPQKPSPHYPVTDEVFELMEPLVCWDRVLIYRLGLGDEVG